MDIPTLLIDLLPPPSVIGSILLNVIGALIVLLIGWGVGLAIGRITKEILLKLKVDRYIARGKKPLFRLSDIFSLIFKWSFYLLAIWIAVGIIGIPALYDVMEAITMNFIPGLIKAVILIIVGYALGEYIKRQIELSKVPYSDIMGRVIFFLVIYIAIAMALPLIGIDPTLVNYTLLIIVGSFGLGMAIAIGWGLKDTIAALAKKYQKKVIR